MQHLLSNEDVAHIAYLARLSLTEDDLEKYKKELSSILDHVGVIEGLNLTNVEPSYQPLFLKNVFRKDIVKDSQITEEVLKEAPAVKETMFVVPPILDEA